MFFTHNVQVQCDLAIARNTRVNVCSLNCLDLFLKYKIGQTCLVCVFVCFGSKCLTFLLLLIDDSESLKCRLDFWLSSMLDCIHICVFLFFEKLFLSISTASRYLSTDCYLSSPSFFLSRQKLTQSRSIKLFGLYLDNFLTILDPSRNFLSGRQILDRFSIHRGQLLLDSCLIASQSVKILLHALFFTCFTSFYYLVIHSILFHYIHAFIWFPFAPLIIFDHLCFSGESLQLLVPFVNHDKKWKKMWFLFNILHVRGRNTCLCKGQMCFILLGGVFTSLFFLGAYFSFLYTGFMTMFTYIVLIFEIYIYIYI